MQERNKWLQVRISEDEREMLEGVARSYGMDTSTFVRAMLRFFDEKHPPLVVTAFAGKALAPVLEMA